MRTRAAVALSVGLLALFGCGRAKPAQDAVVRATAVPPRAAGAPASVAGIDKPETAEPVRTPPPRKLIRNATVTLDVDSVDSTLAAIRLAVQSFGGYVSNESQSQEGVPGPRAWLTCRVPAEKLDGMLARVKALGRPREVAIRADDITEQYFDLEIRLRNEKRLEERLVALLSRPGNDLGDLLNVERELARVRGEIDQMEGRQRYWDSQVALSTVTINVEGPRPALAADEGGIWSSLKSAVSEAGENFVGFVAGLIAALGWFVPLVIALAAGLWLLRRAWRFVRGRGRTKTVSATS